MTTAKMNLLITKELSREKFLRVNRGAKPIGRLGEARFYEHPIHGDESPMVMLTGNMCGLTDFWEMSDVHNCLENLGW